MRALRLVKRASSSTAAQVKSVNDIQKLYYINHTSPGSTFFLPAGTRLFAKLAAFVRSQMTAHGFSEVITPQLYRKELWEQSGHWKHYKDDMFGVTDGHANAEIEYSLKPMNCPGHCLVFKSQERSFRNLPIRYAEFSPLHRNEASGALTGLTRVRRFHQDDGHIFCRPDQVVSEIADSLALITSIYKVFGLQYRMSLSTRPKEFIGDLELWNTAEANLRRAIEASGNDVTIKEGDGAFYGPKIDFVVKDSLGKEHQAATVQLDFQLPRRFELEYDSSEGKAIPVMIHRAVFGSFERFMALLIDHYQGKWPFWLNPRQVVVLPVTDAQAEYAQAIADNLQGKTSGPIKTVPLHSHFFDAEVSSQSEPLSGRLKRALELAPSYVVVVGPREQSEGTVSVRERGTKEARTMRMDDLIQEMRQREASFS